MKGLLATLVALQVALVVLLAVALSAWGGGLQYKVGAVPDARLVDTLNEVGAKGWRVVSARRAVGADDVAAYELIMVRQKGLFEY